MTASHTLAEHMTSSGFSRRLHFSRLQPLSSSFEPSYYLSFTIQGCFRAVAGSLNLQDLPFSSPEVVWSANNTSRLDGIDNLLGHTVSEVNDVLIVLSAYQLAVAYLAIRVRTLTERLYPTMKLRVIPRSREFSNAASIMPTCPAPGAEWSDNTRPVPGAPRANRSETRAPRPCQVPALSYHPSTAPRLPRPPPEIVQPVKQPRDFLGGIKCRETVPSELSPYCLL
jgi:hypothetical protein